MDTNFGLSASSFLVEQSLLLSEFGKELARKTSYVYMDSAFWIDVRVVPRVSSYLEWVKIFTDKSLIGLWKSC